MELYSVPGTTPLNTTVEGEGYIALGEVIYAGGSNGNALRLTLNRKFSGCRELSGLDDNLGFTGCNTGYKTVGIDGSIGVVLYGPLEIKSLGAVGRNQLR